MSKTVSRWKSLGDAIKDAHKEWAEDDLQKKKILIDYVEQQFAKLDQLAKKNTLNLLKLIHERLKEYGVSKKERDDFALEFLATRAEGL